MFDNSEEDKDLASQVSKASSSSTSNDDSHEVIGSPVTPEKLDPSMDLDRKTAGGAESGSGPTAPVKAEESPIKKEEEDEKA